MSADARLRLMLRCNAITDQAARALCYDDAARQALAVEPAGEPAKTSPTPTHAAAKVAVDRSFGADTIRASQRPREEAPASRRIEARLVSHSDDGTGYLVFNLADGMRWQMTEKSEFDLPRDGDTITIRRTMLGGYLMDVGTRSAVRVVRLR
jgi:hypothetical protein